MGEEQAGKIGVHALITADELIREGNVSKMSAVRV